MGSNPKISQNGRRTLNLFGHPVWSKCYKEIVCLDLMWSLASNWHTYSDRHLLNPYTSFIQVSSCIYYKYIWIAMNPIIACNKLCSVLTPTLLCGSVGSGKFAPRRSPTQGTTLLSLSFVCIQGWQWSPTKTCKNQTKTLLLTVNCRENTYFH